jgi:thiol-disulfide isomerase/thioredoxin
MKKILSLLLLIPVLLFAQNPPAGMHFEQGLSWKQVLAKAKAENKSIVMDCYTTWCGPCKYMTANIFPLPEVGGFYNDKYISVKVQLDTTANDDAEVKSWYQDGHDIAQKYNVRAYPTYLFFSPDGEIVHRAVGSSDAQTFINKGKDALVPEKQYYTQLRRYEKGEKDPALLRNVSLMALNAYDMPVANKVSDEYLASQTDLFTKENIDFVDKFTSRSSDKGFSFLLNNTAKVNQVLGAGKAEKKVMSIIMQEELYPSILRRNVPAPDFNVLSEKVKAKYPAYATEAVAKAKVIYYQSKSDWQNFQTEVVAYMKQYGATAEPGELNSYAWTVFEKCKDMTCVAEALEWSKRSFSDKQNPMYMDTYANILHKLGRTSEAIEWQTKAIELADASSKKGYQETLDKMKKGEKTWQD